LSFSEHLSGLNTLPAIVLLGHRMPEFANTGRLVWPIQDIFFGFSKMPVWFFFFLLKECP